VSLHRICVLFARRRFLISLIGMTLSASAQYPGQVGGKSKETVELRAIGVLEWTGEEGKPKASRLVPVTVYDGTVLQDGNVYLARPHPLALGREVEYELQRDGKPIGFFDIKNAGQEQGSWVGYGTWKPLPTATIKGAAPVLQEGADADSDRPVLHRKANEGASGADSSKGSAPAPPSDPDRPTLHKNAPGGDAGAAGSDPAPDPDKPTLHPKDSGGSTTSTADDPDRPKLRGKTQPSGDAAEGGSASTDPDRPLLKRGKSSGDAVEVLPSFMGLPQEMYQAVAISDAKSRPDHPWLYTWANPSDEAKMKAELEEIARSSLGLKPIPAASTPKRASTKTKAKPAPPAPAPAPLAGEQFRVFELAYGSGATMVLTAHVDSSPTEQKFVTLVAQPDLYGNVLVLLKSVTDTAHLDETPRMRLVDAVDVLADNRGELLFELRGATQRQFALYRVLRGRAEKLFATGGGDYGTTTGGQ
jgi:hypothetical protein